MTSIPRLEQTMPPRLAYAYLCPQGRAATVSVGITSRSAASGLL